MNINNINSTNFNKMPMSNIVRERNNVQNTQTEVAQSISSLSSRYTYAMGRDGKRYVLQLTIDIAQNSLNSKA